ncbi:MAG: phosphate ABC transporter permease subunit PstC [Spirochaetales bacterium]|nr:phosphate ABC transporter permease subunit PstC [Spirochaetales bacterium]
MAEFHSLNSADARPAENKGGAEQAPPSFKAARGRVGRTRGRIGEILFKILLTGGGFVVLVIVAGILLSLIVNSVPSLAAFGPAFLAGTTWNPSGGEFGALPFIVGTILTAFLALFFSLPFSLSLSVLLGEYFRKGPFAALIRTMMELLAGIPSVIYGLAGTFFIVPLIQALEMGIGFVPYGVGIISASIVLAVMIIPYSASLGKEVLELVPEELKEGAYSLGATRTEVVTRIMVPYSFSGIIAGITLALGRALGETIAVTMLIGNMNAIPENLFAPGQTIASLIANEFNEAGADLHRASLLELGLILFVITALITILGKYVIRKMSVGGSS